jgi:Bacterial type III secretion protein (HrpB1_HrpK)
VNAMTFEESALNKTLFELLHDEGGDVMLRQLFRQWQDIHDRASAQERHSSDPMAAAKTKMLLYALDQARSILDTAGCGQPDGPAPHDPENTPPSAAVDSIDSGHFPERSTLRFLLNVGLLGIELECFGVARELLTALKTLRPDLPHVQLSAVFLESRAVGVLEARRELLRIIEDFPNFQMGAAMLALMDREARFAGWQGLAEAVVNHARDPPAVNLAEYVLGVKRGGTGG